MRRKAELFVAVLGASNYTYAEVTRSQQLPDWVGGQVRALEHLGGVPEIIVPDQPRTSVKKPCRYDPELNPAYEEFARHYGTCIIPARPRRPRDKAKVEVGVQLAQRWIMAALRNRTFYSIEEINRAITEPLERLNRRPMRELGRSRHELFLALDRPQLKPLPQKRYEYAEWKIGLRVSMDYHIAFDHSYYSVPHHHLREKVDVRATATTVEIFLRQKRIASHARSHRKHHFSTVTEHMPRAHREHLEWTPSRIVKWAETVGPSTAEVVRTIMSERPRPEQGYRACLGILRLEKRYTRERLEKACRRAAAFRSSSYRSVSSIPKSRLENQPLAEPPKKCCRLTRTSVAAATSISERSYECYLSRRSRNFKP